jgi:hypothetical protein
LIIIKINNYNIKEITIMILTFIVIISEMYFALEWKNAILSTNFKIFWLLSIAIPGLFFFYLGELKVAKTFL